MAYMTLLATCFSCKLPFSCNPHLVPSVPAALTGTGEKEPVCRTCVEAANPQRVAKGLAPITILPGAYEPEEVP
jgi:hypothetical protein